MFNLCLNLCLCMYRCLNMFYLFIYFINSEIVGHIPTRIMLDSYSHPPLYLHNITISLLYSPHVMMEYCQKQRRHNIIDPKYFTIYISQETRKKIYSLKLRIVKVQPTCLVMPWQQIQITRLHLYQ